VTKSTALSIVLFPMPRTDLLPQVSDRDKCKKEMGLSFGLWMDNKKGDAPWSTTDFSKNYFTPEVFEASVRKALATADTYVWIYSERPRWWSKDRPSISPRPMSAR
jgi:hypothetical protein